MTPSKIRDRRPTRSGKNSTSIEKTGEKLNAAFVHVFGNKAAVIAISVTSFLILVILGVYLFNKNYADPQRAFWGAISNNLSTAGVTKEFKQHSAANNTEELIQLSFVPNTVVRDIKKASTISEGGNGKVVIESIGTPHDTFQHYLRVEQPTAGKSAPDYNKIYSLWLRNGGNLQSENAQLFNNAIFGAVLFGNMRKGPRTQTITYLKKAYKTDFNNVNRNSGTSRRIYTYNSTVMLKEYARAASFYAKALGLPNARQINPANYKPTDKLEVRLKIDVKSRQVREVTYKATSTTEKYSGYGIATSIKPPAKTVSYETLQQTIKAVTQ